jgi:hypothetical protein
MHWLHLPWSRSIAAKLPSFRPFARHPLPDVRRAVQHRNTLRPTRIEKANALDIHVIYLLQIQSDSGSTALDLGLHLVAVFPSQLPAQLNPRSALGRNPLNSQRHVDPGPESSTLASAIAGPLITD